MKILQTLKTKNNNEVQLISVEPLSYVEGCEKSPNYTNLRILSERPQKCESTPSLGERGGVLKTGHKTLLVVGVVHGDEWQGERIVEQMMKLPHINRVLYIPCLNPDGMALETRTNANGVDLNRNFPAANWQLLPRDRYFGGEEPLSEIESQFLKQVIDEYKPDAILTLHTPFEVVNYDGPACDVAQKMAEFSGYALEESIGYETPGSFGSYFGKEQGYPIITLEMKEIDDCDKLWAELKESLEYFINL